MQQKLYDACNDLYANVTDDESLKIWADMNNKLKNVSDELNAFTKDYFDSIKK